jgi:hypothetical protein
MSVSSTPTRQPLSALIGLELDLGPADALEFDVDGRLVTVRGTDSGVTVVSADGRAVVIRPQLDGAFVVTGAMSTHNPSRPATREDAIRIALGRLGQ